MAKLPLSVQLYTLRDLTTKDFVATVKQVGKIGYSAVELAGFGNLKSAKEVKKAIDDAGLKISGNHTQIAALENDINQVFDENRVLDNRNIIVPWMPPDRRKDADAWKRVGQSLTAIGQQCRKCGFDFAYHNHSFEFEKFNGKYALDILWENSDPTAVRAELDTYWVLHGGEDPAAYINKLGKRIHLLHLKDMAPGPERRIAEVGEGILDFPAILSAAQKAGVQWYVVEQDDSYGKDPIEVIRTSYENLRKLGVA